VRALLDPDAYSPPASAVELVQTHISYVLLAGQDVYKVKKPVNFGFLDFSTLAKRRHFCEEEVRLNQRGCPSIYLGVVPITRDASGYKLGGGGDVVDYAVHMRRLPAEGMMDGLLARGELTHAMVGRLAARLADFHAKAETSEAITRIGGFAGHTRHWQENFEQTRPFVGRTIPAARQRRIEEMVRRRLEEIEALCRRREAEGLVRDCHGDLRSDAVCFEPGSPDGICIFDCIEFNERYRWSDTGLDVGFLAMDLDFRGRGDLGDLFVGLYSAISGDKTLPAALPLYKAYRAYVRGKVEGILMDDTGVSRTARAAATRRSAAYFRLSERYLRASHFRGLAVVMGVSGSGKSVLAGVLASRLGAVLLSTDMVRNQLAASTVRQRERPAYGAGLYAEEERDNVYAAIVGQTDAFLGAGLGVVLDGTFIEARQRGRVTRLARERRTPLLFVECKAPHDVIERRQSGRAEEVWTTSEGRWEVTLRQIERYEPPLEVPASSRLEVDTTLPLPPQVDAVLAALGGPSPRPGRRGRGAR
jgi:uncharacterized protein